MQEATQTNLPARNAQKDRQVFLFFGIHHRPGHLDPADFYIEPNRAPTFRRNRHDRHPTHELFRGLRRSGRSLRPRGPPGATRLSKMKPPACLPHFARCQTTPNTGDRRLKPDPKCSLGPNYRRSLPRLPSPIGSGPLQHLLILSKRHDFLKESVDTDGEDCTPLPGRIHGSYEPTPAQLLDHQTGLLFGESPGAFCLMGSPRESGQPARIGQNHPAGLCHPVSTAQASHSRRGCPAG